MQHIFSDETGIFKIYLHESEASDSTNPAYKDNNIYHFKKTNKQTNKAVKCDVGIDCLNYIQLLYTWDFIFFFFLHWKVPHKINHSCIL